MRPAWQKQIKEEGRTGLHILSKRASDIQRATRQIEIDTKLACGLTAIAVDGDDDDLEWRSGFATEDEGIIATKWGDVGTGSHRVDDNQGTLSENSSANPRLIFAKHFPQNVYATDSKSF